MIVLTYTLFQIRTASKANHLYPEERLDVYKESYCVDGDKTQHLGTPPTFAEDLGFVPNTHMTTHTQPFVTLVPKDLIPHPDFCGNQTHIEHTHICIHTYRQNTLTHKIKTNK